MHFIDGSLNAERYHDVILRPIVVPFIFPPITSHDNAWAPRRKDLYTIPASWTCPCSSFHGLHIHQTCHPLRMFGMLWIDKRVSVPANIRQLRTAIEEEWDNIPQDTINSLINSMRRRCRAAWGKRWSHQILTGFLIHAPPFLLRYVWTTDAYLYYQSREKHRFMT
jgi:hypothetical protein